jgi:hypothetical protein
MEIEAGLRHAFKVAEKPSFKRPQAQLGFAA